MPSVLDSSPTSRGSLQTPSASVGNPLVAMGEYCHVLDLATLSCPVLDSQTSPFLPCPVICHPRTPREAVGADAAHQDRF